MRLTDHQIELVRHLTHQVAGSQSRVRVFGSRLDCLLLRIIYCKQFLFLVNGCQEIDLCDAV